MISTITLKPEYKKQLVASAATMDKHLETYSKDMYNNIFTAFFMNSILSYFTLLYILPFVMEVSFFLSAFILAVVLGSNVIIAITLVVKMFLHLMSLIKPKHASVGQQIMNAKNTFLLTHSRYS